MAEIVAVSTSAEKGQRKKNVSEGLLIKNEGLQGDAHAGFAHRQVSLLAAESIAKMTTKGLTVGPGDFAENLTTQGIDLTGLPVGSRLQAGTDAIIRVTQIGKECHDRCAIYYQAGDCVMPREGIFAEVLRGGTIRAGDRIEEKPSYRFGVITASDKGSCGEREDLSGPALAELLLPWGDVMDYVIVPDDRTALAKMLAEMVAKGADAIFTTGGTGMGPRDVTPEATLEVIDRQVPGIAEAIRRETATVTAKAMLSRGMAGICGKTMIVNLPGSPKAVVECFAVLEPVLDHALETVTGRGGECAR
jgi:molybdopterin adenylyltransferase